MATPSTDHLHRRFLTILPKIETHARIYFRNERCPGKKADRVAECVALAWRWFMRLAEQGKDAATFPTALATFAARHVRNGRRLCGQLRPKDVLSERTQRERGFCVGKIPDFSTLNANPLSEALCDNPGYDPANLAAFRIDFPSWLRTHSRRNRAIAQHMAMGESTGTLANKFKMSAGRISQLRREFHDDWQRFTDVKAVG